MILFVFLAVIAVFVILPLIGWAIWQIISAVIVGLIFGALGRLVVPGRQRMGLLMTAALGLAGSLIGTVVAHAIGLGHLGHVLVEIAASAGLVAVAAGRESRSLTGSGRARLGR